MFRRDAANNCLPRRDAANSIVLTRLDAANNCISRREAANAIDANMCQFCHLKDPSFTIEGLDLHYWKDWYTTPLLEK